MKKNEYICRGDEPLIKLVHKGVYKEAKICSTCNIVKPFRSHHCHDCGNCIYKFDHHCPWIGGCVGGRNYIYFFIFISLLNIKNFFLIIFCIIHIIYIYKDIDEDKKDIKNWVSLNLIGLIPTLITIIFIGCTMVFTIGLNIYHIKLIIGNISTKEDIKKLINIYIGNTYDKGCSNNCKEFWTKHKNYENNYTVKELREKNIAQKNENFDKKINSTKKPMVMPYGYSKKERELLNKTRDKNSNNIKDEQKEKINNNKIEKENKENNGNKENIMKEKKINDEKKNNSSSNKSKEDDFLSIGDISDEDGDYKNKVCNSFVKNRSNLNKKDNLEFSQLENKNILSSKKFNISKDDKGYQIAQKRLEELSSEISINQEMKGSMSIPNENSLNSSLSKS